MFVLPRSTRLSGNVGLARTREYRLFGRARTRVKVGSDHSSESADDGRLRCEPALELLLLLRVLWGSCRGGGGRNSDRTTSILSGR